MGLWIATGIALVFIWIFIGGPDILSMGAEAMLKELGEKESSSHFLSLGMFSSVHGNGGEAGLSGVGCLLIISSSLSSSMSSFSVTP